MNQFSSRPHHFSKNSPNTRLVLRSRTYQMSSSSSSSSSNSSSAPSPKRRHVEDIDEDRRSLVLFLLGAVGYEREADRVARVSKRILESEQIVEGISRFQFPYHDRTRLMYAAKTGNLERLNFIAGLGARVNMTGRGGDGWGGNCTALHFASRCGHTECVRSLCDRGAVIDPQNEYGWTALRLACLGGHLDVVRLLCKRGAQIDQQTNSGRTALYWASENNKIDIACYLCEKGANTLLKCYGRTPYAWACRERGAGSPMALLLEAYPH